ncbi:DtxR family Mn-dependent transcriptional regulator/ferrous iron transport protein A [Prosthecobacter fusiformis]|uniref:DtxR family Mn-dependent transcriptional regulator/ferrous iron transport protein A n=1 Tax=Prosthecobacter fusiformis TaxID=48464 RepID=A0A4R7RI08_9BACT|nr:FeoA family protein [Prosthecobacter fusiformis]TDU62492.1 DtxR family Mn-dependent transcriptional regulator/ferrous iron transport protein A [Prosthecobacter fusiformis]
MHATSTLSKLPIGQTGIIQSMPTGRAGLTRLRELGLTPGAKVTMVRRAPLGEPIEITVRGSHLAMRNHEAADISITLA